MARPISRKVTIADTTRENLISLGVYKQEFEEIIGIYSKLMSVYIALMKEVELEGITDERGDKTSRYAVCEKLRMDILTYANALGLTPAGLKKLEDKSENKIETPNNKLRAILGGKS